MYEALAMIAEIGMDNVYAHLDTFHTNIEEAPPSGPLCLVVQPVIIPVAVGLPPSTLARHPGTQVDAGLVLQERGAARSSFGTTTQ